ncbi:MULTISPECIES: Hsp20/alpha crystallin family protein [Thermoactinomyces]|jgi:HSP20 family protein|uniref:Hsp20/alpha crystallin family protein n=1 Tax=Thermoactinomyces daqus TaxID=1329516 RepID=A0A7W1XCF5_9BACL|nr:MULTISPECIES: Hsp20/alpha crystallin family protein [Thermoactinomyces]MBA4544013.1 Hsp20/alpha crystallin family protein [Thermoactinomyces daqus]MBH8603201.1 Hsp20/alpha crystallin family protein [Thermoactinomyces sp. CICC 10522]MBH8606992.1 Hsp20/alpha crystallin family protein [Thermoactinomyces sp. CICC 10521]
MGKLERYGDRGGFPDPFAYPLAQIHSEINRAFERFFENPAWTHPMAMMPAINMKDDGNQYQIEAEMPGIEEKDVEIEVHGRQLTIKGERTQEERKQGERMYISERRYGSFHRTVTLPEDANLDHITADYENGVLLITVPKVPGKEPRKIRINRNRRS